MRVSWADNGSLWSLKPVRRTVRSPNGSAFYCQEPTHSGCVAWGPINRAFPGGQSFSMPVEAALHLSCRAQPRFVPHVHVGAECPRFTCRCHGHLKQPGKPVLAARCLSIPQFNPAAKDRLAHQCNAPALCFCEPERDGTTAKAAVIINFGRAQRWLLAGMQ